MSDTTTATATNTATPTDQAAIVPYDGAAGGDLMWSTAGFEHAQRIAKMFATSQLVPEHLRGKVADVTIALLMARRLNEDPLIVMQNMHSFKGKAGWNAQYVIARANRSGVFRGRISWRESGKAGAEDYAVTAFATLADTGEEISFEVSMAMARAEGWTQNAKYKSMPQLMLRYRSAVFLVRLNAPDVMLGVSTIEEIEDVDAAEQAPVVVAAATAPKKTGGRGKAALGPAADVIDVEHTDADGAPAPAAATTTHTSDESDDGMPS